MFRENEKETIMTQVTAKQAKLIFAADLEAIANAFVATALADHTAIAALYTKHMSDATKYQAIRTRCWELAGRAYSDKHDLKRDATYVARIAATPLDKCAETDKPMRKAMANKFDYFCNVIGVKAPASINGARKGSGAVMAGSRKAKVKAKAQAKAATTVQTVIKPPVTVKAFTVERYTDVAALSSFYDSVKALMIRTQNENAAVYRNDDGGALLAKHDAIIKAFG